MKPRRRILEIKPLPDGKYLVKIHVCVESLPQRIGFAYICDEIIDHRPPDEPFDLERMAEES